MFKVKNWTKNSGDLKLYFFLLYLLVEHLFIGLIVNTYVNEMQLESQSSLVWEEP